MRDLRFPDCCKGEVRFYSALLAGSASRDRLNPNRSLKSGTTVAFELSRGIVTNLDRRATAMLLTLAFVLVILWALGFLAFGVTSSLIHLLLVIAVVVIIFRLISGRRPVV